MTRPLRTATLAAGLLAVLIAVVSCRGDDGAGVATTTAPPAPETTTTTEPPLEAGEQVFVYQPSVGDCFDRRKLEPGPEQRGQTDIVLLLDCGLPHQNETFAVLDVPGAGRDFPGEEALQDFARANCVADFEAFVGTPYVVSTLEIGYYIPTESSWGAGARTLGCYVYDVDGAKLVGTMRASGR